MENFKIEVGSKNQFIAEFGKPALSGNISVDLFLKDQNIYIASGVYENYKKIITFQDKNKEAFENVLNIKMQKTPAIQLTEDQNNGIKNYLKNRVSEIADKIVSGEITLKAIKNKNTGEFDNFESNFRIETNFKFLNFHEECEVFETLIEKLGYQNRISVDIKKTLEKRVTKEGEFKLTDLISKTNEEYEKQYSERVNLALEKIESNGQDESSGLSNYGIDLFPKEEIKLVHLTNVKLRDDWEDYAY